VEDTCCGTVRCHFLPFLRYVTERFTLFYRFPACRCVLPRHTAFPLPPACTNAPLPPFPCTTTTRVTACWVPLCRITPPAVATTATHPVLPAYLRGFRIAVAAAFCTLTLYALTTLPLQCTAAALEFVVPLLRCSALPRSAAFVRYLPVVRGAVTCVLRACHTLPALPRMGTLFPAVSVEFCRACRIATLYSVLRRIRSPPAVIYARPPPCRCLPRTLPTTVRCVTA